MAWQICWPNLPCAIFETAHGRTLEFGIGQGLQPVFGLEPIQMGVGLAELGVHLGPGRIGHLAGRIVGHDRVLGQRVQGGFLAPIFEKVRLSPTREHSVGHLGRGQIPPVGQDRGLMAVLGQAGDLAQAQLAFEQAHLLVRQKIGRRSSSRRVRQGWKRLRGIRGKRPLRYVRKSNPEAMVF